MSVEIKAIPEMRKFKKPVRKPTRQGSISRAEPPAPGPVFKVAIVGAGGINFGTDEGPWNHSFRLENKLGTRLLVTALIDPNARNRARVLKIKRESFVERAYATTREYDTIDQYLAELTPDDYPRAIIVGSPPQYHGSTKEGRDTELKLTKALPDVALFVEKPVSMSATEDCWKVANKLKEQNTLASVGYMMRYLQVVQKAKEILEGKKLTGVVARYVCSYAKIAKPDWWTFSKSGGPVVEQGTHFCDLCRYFGGEVDLDSVQADAVQWDDPAGQLSAMPIDESLIPEHDRIPRMTSATWRFKDTGAIGSLTHGLVLQGTKYDTTIELYADGYQLRLVDPYDQPRLYVRQPGNDSEELYTFAEDDCYFTEIDTFIDAIETGNRSLILSDFADGVKSYEFSWEITNKARVQAAKRQARSKGEREGERE